MPLSSTQLSALKRPLKRVRNLLADPPPRNHELVFEGYEVNAPEITFTFSALGKSYHSTARIHIPQASFDRLNARDHHPLFVNLGLAFITCHFLLSDFARVNVRCAKLDRRDELLLEAHLLETLAEFRFLSGLDPSRRVEVTSSGTEPLRRLSYSAPKERALLLNGGGKDTCASAELLKSVGMSFSWLNCFPNATRSRVMAASGVEDHFDMRFTVDEAIKRDARYPWGIAPYVYAIHAASLIVAYLHDYRYVVSGSEHSAEEPNLVYKGVEVNHQAAKSIRFENFFNEIVDRSVVENVRAFSVARPFSDFRLAEVFSHFPEYYPAFFSCNVAMGTDKWCNRCHKCAFTYLALYPFMEKDDLDRIFGEALLEVPLIRRHILELTTARIKPWECVGTLEECKLALRLSLKKSPELDFAEWPRRADLDAACADIDMRASCSRSLETFLGPHNLPESIAGPLEIMSGQLLERTRDRLPELLF